ncbi:MAG: 2-oxo acid dehydrogenase subunit E2 [Flavobacteriales bacterium]|jgi:2-oxoglutarate dehydrogenase E2 component (dihydrolipoamide succinyltransferase)|uniref:dihydrolipoamide acetyltransferase family protein n=1 Tax=Blattabacterium sp. (Mastotermes darwiniensis) TaxID=39768 RepID=UPI000231DF31|nr:dihydrolipoamide acetyltransferase family protein [Blattabacterium sp. (Mastotermes darwiniensis)]AER40334.1 2-oxoglutarate dehydrogenase, E2 component [Blattabacterium sp. (Mastotermes darwiniensis) str. MADAR]MDR1804721.1 2-oxo acid dehydrogenase subunit E2 [Flavobacteriales bacterium]
MAEYNLTLPSMGESIAEATIIRWLKKEGDSVKKEDLLVEIATDKVDSEIYSPVNGILKKKLFYPNEVAKVGSSIAILEIEEKNIGTRFYSPFVRTLAHQEGISFYELESIEGTGKKGRVTKKDILKYIQNKKENILHPHNEEIIEMDRIRQITASHMISSKNISAHVTSFVEADVTNIVKWRNKMKDIFQKNTGEKLTLMSVFVKCVVKAIKDLPMINISVHGTNIIKKKNIHIGLATALPNGNLIVPVIKHADSYSLRGLIKIINDLIRRAKSNQLKPEETQGGTYTISNIGSFGNIFGTPIIHQPQVAIMAIGLIQKKLSIIETPKGDFIGIRHKIYLSHSYDHRVINGELGGEFAKKVALYLEEFNCYTKII